MLHNISPTAWLRQLIVFCGVGVINTIFSLLIIFALSAGLGVHYVVANVIGYGCGLVLGFCMHKTYTFRSDRQHFRLHGQILAFFSVFLISYGCQLAFLVLLVETFEVPDMLSQIIAWFLYVPVSFLGNKFLTFRHKPPSP